MTPDELDRLADAAGWMQSYRKGDTDEIPGGQQMIQNAARLKKIAPTLAREHAALLRRAEALEMVAAQSRLVIRNARKTPTMGNTPYVYLGGLESALAALDAVKGGPQ